MFMSINDFLEQQKEIEIMRNKIIKYINNWRKYNIRIFFASLETNEKITLISTDVSPEEFIQKLYLNLYSENGKVEILNINQPLEDGKMQRRHNREIEKQREIQKLKEIETYKKYVERKMSSNMNDYMPYLNEGEGRRSILQTDETGELKNLNVKNYSAITSEDHLHAKARIINDNLTDMTCIPSNNHQNNNNNLNNINSSLLQNENEQKYLWENLNSLINTYDEENKIPNSKRDFCTIDGNPYDTAYNEKDLSHWFKNNSLLNQKRERETLQYNSHTEGDAKGNSNYIERGCNNISYLNTINYCKDLSGSSFHELPCALKNSLQFGNYNIQDISQWNQIHQESKKAIGGGNQPKKQVRKRNVKPIKSKKIRFKLEKPWSFEIRELKNKEDELIEKVRLLNNRNDQIQKQTSSGITIANACEVVEPVKEIEWNPNQVNWVIDVNNSQAFNKTIIPEKEDKKEIWNENEQNHKWEDCSMNVNKKNNENMANIDMNAAEIQQDKKDEECEDKNANWKENIEDKLINKE